MTCPWKTEIKGVLTKNKCQHLPGLLVPTRMCDSCQLMTLAKTGNQEGFRRHVQTMQEAIDPPKKNILPVAAAPLPTTGNKWDKINCGPYKFGEIRTWRNSGMAYTGIIVGQQLTTPVVVAPSNSIRWQRMSWSPPGGSITFEVATQAEIDELFKQHSDYFGNTGDLAIVSGSIVMCKKPSQATGTGHILPARTIFEVKTVRSSKVTKSIVVDMVDGNIGYFLQHLIYLV